MPDTFVKLYRSIITSSVWLEALPTKVVWITMLASADWRGNVWASVKGLAHAAGVTLKECETALDTLSSPDPDSRTKTNEGRRITPIDGGWTLLNHRKYREFRTPTQIKTAERTRRYRAKKAAVTRDVVTPGDAQIEIQKEIENKNEIQTTDKQLALSPSAPDALSHTPWNHRACELVIARYGGTAPGARITKALRPLVKKHGEALVLAAWQRYLEETPKEYLSPEKFATTFKAYTPEPPKPQKPSLLADPAVRAFLKGAQRKK